MKTNTKATTINLVTLGCSKNLVDSEKLMGQLTANHLEVVHNADDFSARTVVINTCGFIKDAKEESIDTILQFVDAREKGLIDHVFVMGCLSERYKTELRKEIPEVDRFFGVNDMVEIIAALGGDYKNKLLGERMISTPPHYAYLKIAEGCDRTCAFCAIPLIRGKHKSIPIENLVSEARMLADKGVKELILIAQDLTYYGLDIYKKQSLADLLRALVSIEGIEWIRLHYTYPASFPSEVIQVMRENDKICNYLDIPFQHISDPVLLKMRRGINSSQTYNLIQQFRNEIPNLTLRTTLMVGHPGEGEKEFQELIDFVKEIRFDRLGVFSYSEEEDTYSASNYSDSIPEKTKEERVFQIMEIQEEISRTINRDKQGKIFKIIIDRREGEFWIGRSEGDSPEVDNEVLIKSDKIITPGEFYRVRITSTDSFDLMGEVV